MITLKHITQIWDEPLTRQVMLIISSVFNITAEFTTQGLTVILLEALKDPDGGFESSQAIVSWIGSSVNLGLLIGILTVPLLLDRFGRKVCHLFTIIPIIIGWLMIIFTNNIYVIIVARVIQGIGAGIRMTALAIIIGECTSPVYRGMFLASFNVSSSLGNFYAHLIGAFYNYRITSAACLMLNIIGISITIALPDSPTGLARAGKLKQAQKAYNFYRGTSDEAIKEYADILKHLDEDKENRVEIRSAVKSKEFWKPFNVVLIAGLARNFSGSNVINNYMLDILGGVIELSTISSYYLMLGIDVLRILITILACFLAKFLKRRLLLHSSYSMTILALLILTIYTFLKRIYVFDINSVAIIGFILYFCGLGTGVQILPNIMTGEIFSVKYKRIGSSLATFISAIVLFIILWLAPYMFSSLGEDGTFLIYACLLLMCWLSLHFILPETKNRTLVDIAISMKEKDNETSSSL